MGTPMNDERASQVPLLVFTVRSPVGAEGTGHGFPVLAGL